LSAVTVETVVYHCGAQYAIGKVSEGPRAGDPRPWEIGSLTGATHNLAKKSGLGVERFDLSQQCGFHRFYTCKNPLGAALVIASRP
jgi:hypothetical protein